MVISHTISLQFKPPAAARIRLLLHAAAHSCAGTAPDRMVRDGNKDEADTGIPAPHLAPIKKVERSKRRDVMALTASLGVITRGGPSPLLPAEPRGRGQGRSRTDGPSQRQSDWDSIKSAGAAVMLGRHGGTAFTSICLLRGERQRRET